MLTSHLTLLYKLKNPNSLHTHYSLISCSNSSFPLHTRRVKKRKKIMMKLLLLSPAVLLILMFFLLCSTTITSGQPSAPAASPSAGSSVSSSAPPDITAILKKAGKFTTFIGLLRTTQVDDLINNQLKSNLGFTVFAPTDTAFSDLESGTLNSLTDEQKTALTKFHIVPSSLSVSQFQTVSNPVNTVAGNSAEFPLNVVSNGTQVNITTGQVNTTVDSTVYSDGQLAVYEIPDVLLAQGIVKPLAEAPLSPKPEKASAPTAYAPAKSTGASAASSDAPACLSHYAPSIASVGVAVLAAVRLCL